MSPAPLVLPALGSEYVVSVDLEALLIVTSVCLLCLTFLLSVVMLAPAAAPEAEPVTADTSAAMREEAPHPDVPPSRVRRFRSLSVSIDLEFPERSYKAPVFYRAACWKDQKQQVLASADRYRTMSTNCIGKYPRTLDRDLITQSKEKGLEMLRKMPETFPLQMLPEDCKLRILSFLSPKERGVAAQVCKEWSRLTIVPSLWSVVDFTKFPTCARCLEQRRECNMLCYASFKTQMKKFFRYLIALRPALRRLKFEFDIDKDGWLELLQSLLRSAHCHDLHSVYLNWKETTMRPQSSNSVSHTWSTSDYNDLMFHHRHRQRLFVKFFDFVVTAAPNIQRLTLPFDWSDRSMRALGRLRYLHTLVLQTYFWTHWVEQAALSLLLDMTPGLRTLVLEVCSHSVQGLTPYTFESASLEQLDMSASRGLCLARVSLPRLKRLSVSRQPIPSPLVTMDAPQLPCLYEVLCEGAPNLRRINALSLRRDWTDNLYEELDQLLHNVCSCARHNAA